MRKINFITMLVLMVGASFLTSAQGTALPYTMDTSNVSDWSLTHTGSYDPNSPYNPEATYVFNGSFNTLIFEKSFDFSNSTDAEITFEFIKYTGVININYRIEIDGIEYYNSTPTNSNVIDTINLSSSNIDLFSDPNNVSVKIFIEYETESGTFIGYISDFKINHTEIGAGIDENNLSDKLEVYSFNKSVFIKSNEPMNVEVTVYNMNGQIVKTKILELSNTLSVIDLSNNSSGFYVVNINGVNVNKIYVQ